MTLLLHGPAGSRPTWVTAIAPTEDELTRLRSLGFDDDSLEHALDPNERPRARAVSGTTLLVFRTPIEPSRVPAPHVTVPIGVLLRDDIGLTICAVENGVIDDLALFAETLTGKDAVHQRRPMLARLLDRIATAFLTRLDETNRAIDEIEQGLETSLENREVLALLAHQKTLVQFTGALEAMQFVFERLQKLPVLATADGDDGWLDDVLVEFHQAVETSRLASNVLSETMDAFASIISNNLNVVMKFLASVTIILTVPAMLSSFYGMNVGLPGQGSRMAFLGLVLLSIAVSAITAVVFRKRRWL